MAASELKRSRGLVTVANMENAAEVPDGEDVVGVVEVEAEGDDDTALLLAWPATDAALRVSLAPAELDALIERLEAVRG